MGEEGRKGGQGRNAGDEEKPGEGKEENSEWGTV
jgi:hypothetical protein